MIWQRLISIGLGVLIAGLGIGLMSIVTPVFSVIMVLAGGFLATTSLWELVDVFRNPPYTRTYTNDWF